MKITYQNLTVEDENANTCNDMFLRLVTVFYPQYVIGQPKELNP